MKGPTKHALCLLSSHFKLNKIVSFRKTELYLLSRAILSCLFGGYSSNLIDFEHFYCENANEANVNVQSIKLSDPFPYWINVSKILGFGMEKIFFFAFAQYNPKNI